ncbi:MAG: FAD-dependent oxidoreductase [Nocardioides sp.]|nr:FAD-dependent oxidoreductase [Nocardioides sp.]
MVETWDEQYDVVVVGSGAAAMAGAWQAARAGLSTVVLEKTALLGGTSAYSGAACWLPGTDVQQRAGNGDSTEAARTYLRSLLGKESLAKQEAFLETAPRLVAELEADPAIEFTWRAFPDYFDLPGRVPNGRSFVPVDLPAEELGELAALVRPIVDRDRLGKGHGSGPLSAGRALIGRLLLALDRTGNGTVRVRHSVDGLVTDADGRVVGVEASTEGGRVRIGATRGVLLAAGGFERSATVRAEHGLPGSADWSMAPAGSSTGDAAQAAVALGAATDLMDQAWWAPGVATPEGAAAFAVGFRGGIVVDQHGHRYANESLPYDRFGREMAADPARVPSYAIFDARTSGQFPAYVVPGVAASDALEAGTWFQADTLEELADLAGLPREALVETVTRFNGFAAAGLDEDFGRGQDEFDRFFANPALVPVDQGPFVAARLVLADLGTKGGLVTDVDSRVLREDGTALAGLYAAGNTSASWTGPFYPGPGIPIGSGMVAASRAVSHLLG